ncbi:hypothetical protein D3C78_1937620 [compost metagenome]
MGCLARTSKLEPVAPYKYFTELNAINPFNTKVKSLFCSSVSFPNTIVRVISVVPS